MSTNQEKTAPFGPPEPSEPSERSERSGPTEPSKPPGPPRPSLPDRTSWLRSRWAALGVLSTTMLMAILDGSIVTVATPAIQRDLGFSPAGLSWIMNAYLIPLGGLLLLAGRLGDLVGRRPLFLTGNAVFTAAVSIGVVSLFVSARLSNRFGEHPVLVAGLVLLTGAMLLLRTVPVDADYVTDLLPPFLLIAGGGLVLPSLTGLAMSGAGPDDAGLASGLFNTVQQVGMALGVAVMTTLAASRITDLRAAGHAEPAALTGGYHLAFSVSAGLLIAALAVSLLVLRNPGPPPSTPAPKTSTDPAESASSPT